MQAADVRASFTCGDIGDFTQRALYIPVHNFLLCTVLHLVFPHIMGLKSSIILRTGLGETAGCLKWCLMESKESRTEYCAHGHIYVKNINDGLCDDGGRGDHGAWSIMYSCCLTVERTMKPADQ